LPACRTALLLTGGVSVPALAAASTQSASALLLKPKQARQCHCTCHAVNAAATCPLAQPGIPRGWRLPRHAPCAPRTAAKWHTTRSTTPMASATLTADRFQVTTICVSAYYSMCVIVLLYMIMCPHTPIYLASSYSYVSSASVLVLAHQTYIPSVCILLASAYC
jgi:hypothetical protein